MCFSGNNRIEEMEDTIRHLEHDCRDKSRLIAAQARDLAALRNGEDVPIAVRTDMVNACFFSNVI